ncbi:MAG: TonB-dependent receptor domain-containing protein [Acidobacteriota bacterium]|jgi:outer membrane receptor protein involved in Fe transport|nr:TonB-dependent receptor [Bryobacteraceae bacterium CoA2 C42]MCA2963699.1 TonB-dependent receptor [Acidobacteriaceae bacterium]
MALSLLAQGERANVTGTITDASGATIPDAAVAIRNTATNVTTRSTTNNAGLYYLTNLQPGEYEINITKQGFRPARVAALRLTVGLTATVPVTLEVGTVTEAVEVTATAVQLEAQTSGLGKVVEQRRVVELPLLGRNPLALAATAPGVLPTSGQRGTGQDIVGVSTTSQINGGLAQQNGVLIDGGESRGTTESGNAYTVPLEAVGEFKVETSTYSAEFGRAAGGIVNVATKSGTNQLHGVAYEFLRNDHLNANSWQNNRNRVPKGLFQRNEFGAGAGGKIIKDRTFWFAIYEGTRQGSPDQALLTVPTALQRQGDFSQTFDRTGRLNTIYDYTTTRTNPTGGFIRDPFPGNRIPSTRVHPISARVVPFWGESNRPGEGASLVNNYFRVGKSITNSDSWFGRIDHILSDRHRLYGRYGGRELKSSTQVALNPAFPPRSLSSNPANSALISLTSTFSPTMIGEGRISYTRLQFDSRPLSEGFDVGSLGFSNAVTRNILFQQFPQVSIQTYAQGAGLAVTGAAPNEFDQLGGVGRNLNPQDTWHAQYHATIIKTRHKIKAGADHQLIKLNAFNSQQSAGQYIFDRVYSQGPDPTVTALNSGHGFASFLLGVPQDGAITITRPLFLYQRYWGAYIQDDWRVTDKLTLNLGFRYEYTTPYAEKFGQIGYIDFDAVDPVAGTKGTFKLIEPGGYQSDPNRKNFSPRLGIAYQLNSKTVIRTGAAVFYASYLGVNAAATDFGNGSFLSNALFLGQPNTLPSTPPVGGSWSNPFAGGIIVPDRNTNFAGQNVRADVRYRPNASMGNWSFSIQRMLSSNTLFEVAYVGSKTSHLYWNRQRNQNDPSLMRLGSQLLQPVPNPFFGKIRTGALSGPTISARQALRPYPQFLDLLIFRDPYGDLSYQSWYMRLEKQYSNGMTLSASFTGSKTIANTMQSNTWVVGPSNSLYNARYNRGIEANDIPQRLVLSYLYDLPFGKGRKFLNDANSVVQKIAGGWQVSSITVLQKGRPVMITAPDTTSLFNFSSTNGRANRLKDPVLPSDQQSLTRWFDTTAFERAAPFTLPTDSVSQPRLRGPGRVNFDVSFLKNTRFGERYNLQFRGEFYNISNTPALDARGATTDVANPLFGQIVQGGNPRNIQFGLRFVF